MTSVLIVRTKDRRNLRVVDGGDPRGWPIVVHHGTPMAGDLYAPLERYAKDHGIRLISYDRPGYRDSDPSPGRRVASAGQDVSTIAAHLGIARFSVWGHSGGGPHALACAATLPNQVASAVASASVAPYAAQGLDWLGGMGEGNVREFRAALEGKDSLERSLKPEKEAMMREGNQPSPAVLTLLSPEDFELLRGELGSYLMTAMRSGVQRSLEGWVDDDLAFLTDWGFDLGGVKIPTSIWHGKLDRFVPHAHGVWLSEHIPQSELHSFDQETHLTLFERRFSEIVQWLQDHARGH